MAIPSFVLVVGRQVGWVGVPVGAGGPVDVLFWLAGRRVVEGTCRNEEALLVARLPRHLGSAGFAPPGAVVLRLRQLPVPDQVFAPCPRELSRFDQGVRAEGRTSAFVSRF